MADLLESVQLDLKPIVIHPMEYRNVLADRAAAPRLQEDAQPVPSVRELEMRIRELEAEIEQRSQIFESDLSAACMEARQKGRTDERSEQADRIGATAQQLSGALAEFAAERERYLAKVEQEVVRLALAIAAKILHREAQMDPLLLTGAVRVALGHLSDTTEVRLIVPATEQGLWSEFLRLMPNLPLRPELVADDALSEGQCRIETQVGNIDLGVSSQLAEIERGFFDLLEKREGVTFRAQQGSGQQEQQKNLLGVDN